MVLIQLIEVDLLFLITFCRVFRSSPWVPKNPQTWFAGKEIFLHYHLWHVVLLSARLETARILFWVPLCPHKHSIIIKYSSSNMKARSLLSLTVCFWELPLIHGVARASYFWRASSVLYIQPLLSVSLKANFTVSPTQPKSRGTHLSGVHGPAVLSGAFQNILDQILIQCKAPWINGTNSTME